MKSDPFGHIAVARHFQNAARGRLAGSKTAESKTLWADYIEEIERRIKHMEETEIEFWKELRKVADRSITQSSVQEGE